jgi:hypothetical protein
MTDQGSFFEVDTSVERAAANMEMLRQIRMGKIRRSTKAANVLMAHGLAYDPHVDGRLKLTPAGLAQLKAAV